MSRLCVQNLHVAVDGKEILHGIDLIIGNGEVHVVMGPNGSGKSTLVNALMGSPVYRYESKARLDSRRRFVDARRVQSPKSKVERGLPSITLDNREMIDMPIVERVKLGLFLSFQSPIAIPGVSVTNVLRTAYQELYGEKQKYAPAIENPVLARRFNAKGMQFAEFIALTERFADMLMIPHALLARGINDGFSGGERKKIEMLTALILKPKFAMFDEIDTGLDVDALKLIAQAIITLKHDGCGICIVTHYQRILRYIQPDYVHILVNGRVVKTGTSELAKEIEENGYEKFKAKVNPSTGRKK